MSLTDKVDHFTQQWRGGHKEQAVKIANDITSDLESVDCIDPVMYKFLHFNLNFARPTGKHIIIVNTDSRVITPHTIRRSENTSGSEEALIKLSEHLVLLGYRVTIMCNIPIYSGYTLPCNNPRYYNSSGLGGIKEDDKIDLTVAWRRTDFHHLHVKTGAPVVYFPHDWYSDDKLVTKSLSGICFLSSHQKQPYPDIDVPCAVIGNGVNMSEFTSKNVVRNQLRCIYCSAYNRGLEGILRMWPIIHQSFPDAELHVYYGRNTFLPGTERLVDELVKRMAELSTMGVIEKGRVSHNQLALALLGSSIICAESHFQETYGIVYAKAMAAGVIPVVTNVIDRSIVPDVIPYLDEKSESLSQELRHRLLYVLTEAKKGNLESLRNICINHAQNNLTWHAASAKMAAFIESVTVSISTDTITSTFSQ